MQRWRRGAGIMMDWETAGFGPELPWWEKLVVPSNGGSGRKSELGERSVTLITQSGVSRRKGKRRRTRQGKQGKRPSYTVGSMTGSPPSGLTRWSSVYTRLVFSERLRRFRLLLKILKKCEITLSQDEEFLLCLVGKLLVHLRGMARMLPDGAATRPGLPSTGARRTGGGSRSNGRERKARKEKERKVKDAAAE